MKPSRVLSALVALPFVAMQPEAAAAQCSFDSPTKAKGFKSSMVRAYSECPTITPFILPNTSTMAAVPACAPPIALSTYEFDDDAGGCTIRLSQSVETPCFDGDPSCGRIEISAQCSGIRDPGGATLTNTPGWALAIVARVTIADETRGDMTVLDQPAQFNFPQASAGKLKLTYDSSECTGLFCDPFTQVHAVPACAQLSILSASVRDPAGKLFAVMGSSSR
jgi:hypothetical protein